VAHADDAGFRAEFRAVKAHNKQRLATMIHKATGVTVNPASLFDVQVKRIHEYKRQLLNVLHVVTRYRAILAQPNAGWVPRVVIFAGKAASSYTTAKNIIRLIHDVGQVINNDPRIGDTLKLVFIPNYGVGGRDHHAGGRPVRADQHRRHRGVGHRQHEAGAQRRADHRHRRRRQHRDPPERGRRQHLHLRQVHAEVAAIRAAGYQPMRIYEQQPAAQGGARRHRRRRLLARRAGRYRR
jgi:starch phosphorylase